MSDTRSKATEHEIAVCAYCIWEQEGTPSGRALDHWLQAELQLAASIWQESHRPLQKKTTFTQASQSANRSSGCTHDRVCREPVQPAVEEINEKSAPIALDLRGHQVLASRRIPGHLVVSPKSRSLSGRLACTPKFSPVRSTDYGIQAANGKVILAMAIRASISGASWTRPAPCRPTAGNSRLAYLFLHVHHDMPAQKKASSKRKLIGE